MPFPLPTTTWALVLANLVPLVGVLLWGWRADDVLWLYWLENLVVGALTLLRIAFAPGPFRAKAFLMPFFTAHFGLFCLVHAVFLAHLAGGGVPDDAGTALDRFAGLWGRVGPSVAVLAGAHVLSFLRHDIAGGRLASSDPGHEMVRPYGRIFLMQFVVLLGGALAAATGSAVPALVALVGIKIGLDAAAHLRSHPSHPAGEEVG